MVLLILANTIEKHSQTQLTTSILNSNYFKSNLRSNKQAFNMLLLRFLKMLVEPNFKRLNWSAVGLIMN